MRIQNTTDPYDTIEREPIQYSVCRDYDHISRYKGLRQVVHEADMPDRYVALETPNTFRTNTDVEYYVVPANLENRLDIIARDKLGSEQYAWVLAYFNGISDGFTVEEGTKLAIPTSITALFNNGEILSAIPATKLNLGSE